MTLRTFNNLNNDFLQNTGSLGVLGDTFNFMGGNDRMVLLRNDDLAGLGSTGVANMGDGHDTVLTSFNTTGTFNLGAGNDVFVSDGNSSLSIPDVHVNAGTGNDVIAVSSDVGIYKGEDGNDIFVSNGSKNQFFGGNGNDTYSAELVDKTTGARIDLAAGTGFARFNLSSDVFTSIENARGSQFNDTIFGNSGNNRLDGLRGNDAIDGDLGNDTISGGTGTNDLFGNTGTDTLVVEGTLTSRTGTVANFTVIGTLGGVAFRHNAHGFEKVLINGFLTTTSFFLGLTATNNVTSSTIAENAPAAIINGAIDGKVLNGTNTANTLNGGIGTDDISGFNGNDTLRGNNGTDRISGGNDNDRLEGGNGNDLLFGQNGNDTLLGGANNDTLSGGAGVDRLSGGSNNDVFVFDAALGAANADVVTDYNVAQDSIRINSLVVGGLADGALAAAAFKNTALGAIDSNDRIIYDSASGNLFFDSNGSASGGRLLIAEFAPGLAMAVGEFTII